MFALGCAGRKRCLTSDGSSAFTLQFSVRWCEDFATPDSEPLIVFTFWEEEKCLVRHNPSLLQPILMKISSTSAKDCFSRPQVKGFWKKHLSIVVYYYIDFSTHFTIHKTRSSTIYRTNFWRNHPSSFHFMVLTLLRLIAKSLYKFPSRMKKNKIMWKKFQIFELLSDCQYVPFW